jgi:hypothetical protein
MRPVTLVAGGARLENNALAAGNLTAPDGDGNGIGCRAMEPLPPSVADVPSDTSTIRSNAHGDVFVRRS